MLNGDLQSVIERYMEEKHFDHSTNEDIAPLVGASGKM